MIQKRRLLLLPFILFFFLVSCSEKETSNEKITGAMVADVSLSTLTIRVLDDTGIPLSNALVLVNGKEKGKTTAYGSSRGTKRVALDGPLNLIRVRKDGYLPAETSVSAVSTGEQSLTLILEKKRTALKLEVLEKSLPVYKAEASLYQTKNGAAMQAHLTDRNGTTLFPKLDNGNYRLRLEKESYLPRELMVSINYSRDGEVLEKVFELTKIPHLDVDVTDVDDNGLKEVEVSLYSKEEYNSPGAFPLHVKYTSAEGKVQFIPLELDEGYIITLKKRGYRAQLHEKVLTEEDQLLMVKMAAPN